MIRSFRSRALKRLWEWSDQRKLPAEYLIKITQILDVLEAAGHPEDMDLPGFEFHGLKGQQKGRFAVTVQANWRITFAWGDEEAIEVDYEDYPRGPERRPTQPGAIVKSQCLEPLRLTVTDAAKHLGVTR